MYLLMAYINGDWAIKGFDEHEECAVMFIDEIDKQFGEDTAFVVKMPDRSHKDPGSVQDILHNFDKLDLDEALQNFNNHNR